jgi:hypothetical protein
MALTVKVYTEPTHEYSLTQCFCSDCSSKDEKLSRPAVHGTRHYVLRTSRRACSRRSVREVRDARHAARSSGAARSPLCVYRKHRPDLEGREEGWWALPWPFGIRTSPNAVGEESTPPGFSFFEAPVYVYAPGLQSTCVRSCLETRDRRYLHRSLGGNIQRAWSSECQASRMPVVGR